MPITPDQIADLLVKALNMVTDPKLVDVVDSINKGFRDTRKAERINCVSILQELETNLILCEAFLRQPESAEAFLSRLSTEIYDGRLLSGMILGDIKRKRIKKFKVKEDEKFTREKRIRATWSGGETKKLIAQTYFKIKELKALYPLADTGKVRVPDRVEYIKFRIELLRATIDCG